MQKIICFSLLFLSLNVFSQKNEQRELDTTRTIITEISRNVFWINPMKHFGWVTDKENLYTKSEIAQLNSVIDQFEKETTMEIAIVTLDALRVSEDRFDELSLRIVNQWGVGKFGKDNGILIAISKVYRRIRIQNGNGIEKILSNEEGSFSKVVCELKK